MCHCAHANGLPCHATAIQHMHRMAKAKFLTVKLEKANRKTAVRETANRSSPLVSSWKQKSGSPLLRTRSYHRFALFQIWNKSEYSFVCLLLILPLSFLRTPFKLILPKPCSNMQWRVLWKANQSFTWYDLWISFHSQLTFMVNRKLKKINLKQSWLPAFWNKVNSGII